MSHISSVIVPTEVTQCPVCCELLVDARQLPVCLHVYCLRCVEAFTGWRRPEDDGSVLADDEDHKTAACPLCAVTFDIPDEGPASLPRSAFIEKLVEARKLKRALEADDDHTGCELCSEPEEPTRPDEPPATETDSPLSEAAVKKATHYCVDCGQKMCDQCGTMHRRMKATSGHQLVDLGAKAAAATEAVEKQLHAAMAATTSCAVHPAENLKVYCNDCMVAICTMCHIESHNGHDCADIARVADDLRRHVRDDIKQLSGQITRCRSETTRLERAKADFARTILKIQMQIADSTERLKRLVDDHRKRLLTEVTSVSDMRRRETESVESDVARHLSALETFCRYADELVDRGSACDIAEAADRIRRRADALRLFDVSEHIADKLRPINVAFAVSAIPSRAAAADGTNVVGSVTVSREEEKAIVQPPVVERNRPPSVNVQSPADPPAPQHEAAPPCPEAQLPTLVHITPAGGRPVLGVAAAGDEVYVVRHATPEVEVYEAAGLTLRRRIQMPGLGSWPFGLAVGTGCLYVSDFVNNAIHRVETVGMSTVTARWPVAGGPAGLSVIAEGEDVGNVVVVCSTSLKIQVYAPPQGTLMFEIRLKIDLTPGPSHAVRLIGGQFLLSHASVSGRGQSPLHRICIVEKVENDDEPGVVTPQTDGAPAEQPQQKSHRKILPVLRRESKKPPKQPAAPSPADAAIAGTSPHVASFDGRVVLSYGNAPGSGDGQLSAPKGLAVDTQRGGCVFVADRDNNRLVVVDHALGAAHPLTLTAGPGIEDCDLRAPRCLHLDQTRGRLYVGEETDGGRLIAIDHIDMAVHNLL